MKKEDVYVTLDKLKEGGFMEQRISSYIEANIDEFLECYEDEK